MAKIKYQFNSVIDKNKPRSKFDMSFTHKTTFNTGDLVPVLCQEIVPGDTIHLDTNAIARQTTLLKPVMDNAYIDVNYFFVPWRIIWDDYSKFFGYNEDE